MCHKFQVSGSKVTIPFQMCKLFKNDVTHLMTVCLLVGLSGSLSFLSSGHGGLNFLLVFAAYSMFWGMFSVSFSLFVSPGLCSSVIHISVSVHTFLYLGWLSVCQCLLRGYYII